MICCDKKFYRNVMYKGIIKAIYTKYNIKIMYKIAL